MTLINNVVPPNSNQAGSAVPAVPAALPDTASTGVTITPASHSATLLTDDDFRGVDSSEALLRDACRKESMDVKELLHSSFTVFDANQPIVPSTNGFVHSAIQAYNTHHHLIIRPEDVWFSILTQFSLYVNANVESLRGKFVAHEGKKELEIIYGDCNRYTVSIPRFIKDITNLLEQNIVDASLREWIIPDFSTTNPSDKTIASALMMGALKTYFTYKLTLRCGIPSVTLLGTRSDWATLTSKLENLKSYGPETAQWYALLHPILTRFVHSFDAPNDPDTITFWQQIAHFKAGGSGPSYYSGWITAFCFWDGQGKCLYPDLSTARSRTHYTSWTGYVDKALKLDGATYHRIDTKDVPSGYSVVPVKVDDNGYKFDAKLIAGSVGKKFSSSGEITEEGVVGFDTVQAVSGWWFYEEKRKGDNGETKDRDGGSEISGMRNWR